ncbi:MAG: hypothetical protein ABFD79_11300 [Phycisphaerales bacterium]
MDRKMQLNRSGKSGGKGVLNKLLYARLLLVTTIIISIHMQVRMIDRIKTNPITNFVGFPMFLIFFSNQKTIPEKPKDNIHPYRTMNFNKVFLLSAPIFKITHNHGNMLIRNAINVKIISDNFAFFI